MAVSRNSSWGELLKHVLSALCGISGFTLSGSIPISASGATLSSGAYTILANDTPESISAISVPCKKVYLHTPAGNGGNVAYGGATPVLTGANSDLMIPGADRDLDINNLNLIRVYGKIGYKVLYTFTN